ncbi:hypothetical protein Tco_0363842 [Tanacetum coccineum]
MFSSLDRRDLNGVKRSPGGSCNDMVLNALGNEVGREAYKTGAAPNIPLLLDYDMAPTDGPYTQPAGGPKL